jgi:disulfide bond formation protein DsbB
MACACYLQESSRNPANAWLDQRGEDAMDEQASEKVEPTKREQQRNREREVMGFNIGLWAMVAIVAIVIVVVALFLI